MALHFMSQPLTEREKINRPQTFEEIREVIGTFLKSSGDAGRLWDLITCLRGPDFPSERGDMESDESSKAYRGRRERKARTVEVIRYHAFNGASGGSARLRSDRNYVILPPREQWDHFDRHVSRAATILGLEVKIGKDDNPANG